MRVPAAEEGVDAVDVVNDFDGLHCSIEAFGDCFFELGWCVAQFAGEVAEEGSEQEHFDVVVACIRVH